VSRFRVRLRMPAVLNNIAHRLTPGVGLTALTDTHHEGSAPEGRPIMESLGNPRRRHSFTAEFKAETVELCQRGDRAVGQVARD
jgi:hypothetical protein